MIALGVDLGGTKIEAQIFDEAWQIRRNRRVDTPATHDALIQTVADLVAWSDGLAGRELPVGIGAAGLVNPRDGTIIAGNLPSTGQPLPHDIAAAIGRPVTYLNDCKALALSEAVLGVGASHDVTLCLVLGTGVSAGVTMKGQLLTGPTGTGGEVGQIPASAHLLDKYDLPILPCGCGRRGCIETLISAPGLARIGKLKLGKDLSVPDLIAARQTDPKAQTVWDIWCALTADLIQSLILTIDPDCVILGGGLSKIPNVTRDLQKAAQEAQFQGFGTPPILLAQGGDTSGARGAAYAARKGGV